ncbi:hypothetical protein PV325_006677 [Microctonus aethiopoides]|nr:hypothetical protein PV325_006677 [Microctonus aethiopoides]
MDMKGMKGIGKSLLRTDEEQLRYSKEQKGLIFMNNILLNGKIGFGVKKTASLQSLETFWQLISKNIEANFYFATWVDWNWTVYKPNMFVHIDYIDDVPECGMIEFVLVDESNKISFIVTKMQIVKFLTHYQALEIVGIMTWLHIKRKNLVDYICSNSNVLEDVKICI